jgi:hypothetical protein
MDEHTLLRYQEAQGMDLYDFFHDEPTDTPSHTISLDYVTEQVQQLTERLLTHSQNLDGTSLPIAE